MDDAIVHFWQFRCCLDFDNPPALDKWHKVLSGGDAYAAAGIAGSNPFQTGNTAFRLGIAKALVPFVFVYSPALLLVANGFTWWAFTVTLIGAMLGIASLGVAFSGYLFAPLKTWERWWVALVSFLLFAPSLSHQPKCR